MISNRLLEICKYVDNNSKILDVGCDHGLLSIYLYLNRNNVSVIASDVNQDSIDAATKNVIKYGLKGNVDIVLSDGFDSINMTDIDSVIIAGLGGRKIVSILKTDQLKHIKKIILQPNNNAYDVRKHLVKAGFYISRESLLLENRKIYTTIVFEVGHRRYSMFDLYFGPHLRREKSDLFVIKVNKEIFHITNNLRVIPRKEYIKKIGVIIKLFFLKRVIKKAINK